MPTATLEERNEAYSDRLLSWYWTEESWLRFGRPSLSWRQCARACQCRCCGSPTHRRATVKIHRVAAPSTGVHFKSRLSAHITPCRKLACSTRTLGMACCPRCSATKMGCLALHSRRLGLGPNYCSQNWGETIIKRPGLPSEHTSLLTAWPGRRRPVKASLGVAFILKGGA